MSTMHEEVRVRHIIHTRNTKTDEYSLQINSAELNVAFKELVRRGLNCWPEAHPELKELGDILDHGRILQDYWASRTDISGKVRHPDLPTDNPNRFEQ